MTNRSAVWGVAGVGGLLLVAAGSGTGDSAPWFPPEVVTPSVGSDQSGTQDPVAAGRVRTGRLLIEEFLGEGLGDLGGGAGIALDAMIATLPDPVDSHLDWTYDSLLEAIRRAYEASGYVLDRFWLPPRRDSVTTAGPGGTTLALPVREAYPGVFLFRGTRPVGPPPGIDLRVLYVVPELPTSGLYKHAFRQALSEAWDLLALPPFRADDRRTVRIVGPTFSGTTVSLRRELETWWSTAGRACPRPSSPTPGCVRAIRIVSGSATNAENRRTLEGRGEQNGPPVEFRATVNSDQTLTEAIGTLILPRLRVRRDQVAILREGTTAYAQDIAGSEDSILTIPFPMNISAVRSEYERNPVPEPDDPTGLARPGPRIPLELRDADRPRETPLVWSRLTPPMVDIMLAQIVETLRRHDIRAVGLFATDVRDKLFLGEVIKRNLRDVRLFTFESNTLFLRADRTHSLHGMLVLSTYPLFLEGQRWMPRQGRREPLAFSHEGAAGTFNATLTQLSDTPALVSYRAPCRLPACPPGAWHPPIWLTVVGERAILPVDLDPLPIEPHDPYVHRAVGADVPTRSSRSGIGFILGAAFIALSLTGCGWATFSLATAPTRRANARTSVTAARAEVSQRTDLPACIEWVSLFIHREVYSGLLGVCLVGLVAPPTAVLLRDWLDHGRGIALVAVGLVAVVGLTAAVTTHLVQGMVLVRVTFRDGVVLLTQRLGRSTRGWLLWNVEVAARTATAAIGLLYFGTVLVLCARMLTIPDVSWWLFFYRTIHLASGVSPLPPLMLIAAGFGIWAVWHLRRIAALMQTTPFERFIERSTDEPVDPRRIYGPALRAVRTAVFAVRNRLFFVVPDSLALALGAVLLAGVAVLATRFGNTLESPHVGLFDEILRFGALATLVAIPWATYRLLSTWFAMRKQLRGIATLPLLSAFDRLPSQIARVTRLTFLRRSGADLIRSVAHGQWIQLKNIWVHRGTQFATADGTQGESGSVATRPDTARLAEHIAKLMKPVAADAPALERYSDTTRSRRRVRASGPERTVGLGSGEELVHLADILETAWAMEPTSAEIGVVENALVAPVGPPDPQLASAVTRFRSTFVGPLRLWIRCAEEYATVWVVDYIEQVLEHLRNLVLFLFLALLLATALLSSYPYHPQSQVKLIFFFVAVVTVAAMLLVMVQFSQDEVMSRITKTDPGRVKWDTTFVSNVMLLAVIPLLSLVSAEFPALRGALFAWIQPLRTLLGGP